MKYVLLAIMSFMMSTTLWHPLATQVAGTELRQDTSTIAGEWFLQPVLASDTATGKLPVLRFNLSNKTFTGFTGCNQMSGSFLLQQDAIQFNQDINLTKMACEGYNEKEFLINLLRVNNFKIRDGVLWLMTDQTPVSRWMWKTPTKQIA